MLAWRDWQYLRWRQRRLGSPERIYHVPGQKFYSETIITAGKGERWFCSEDEARAAGWRKAMR
ncbi:MAG: hypothetical protein WBA48_18260 [Xanthobacteraceae bacterium]